MRFHCLTYLDVGIGIVSACGRPQHNYLSELVGYYNHFDEKASEMQCRDHYNRQKRCLTCLVSILQFSRPNPSA